MFARSTKFIGFFGALIAIACSLALAQNFPVPNSTPQFITPQGDPPPLLNQGNEQFNGQFNGQTPADSAPRLNQPLSQTQPYQAQPSQGQFYDAQPPSQVRPQANNAFACQWDRSFAAVCGYDPAAQSRFAEPPMPAGFHCQEGYCPLDASSGDF